MAAASPSVRMTPDSLLFCYKALRDANMPIPDDIAEAAAAAGLQEPTDSPGSTGGSQRQTPPPSPAVDTRRSPSPTRGRSRTMAPAPRQSPTVTSAGWASRHTHSPGPNGGRDAGHAARQPGAGDSAVDNRWRAASPPAQHAAQHSPAGAGPAEPAQQQDRTGGTAEPLPAHAVWPRGKWADIAAAQAATPAPPSLAPPPLPRAASPAAPPQPRSALGAWLQTGQANRGNGPSANGPTAAEVHQYKIRAQVAETARNVLPCAWREAEKPKHRGAVYSLPVDCDTGFDGFLDGFLKERGLSHVLQRALDEAGWRVYELTDTQVSRREPGLTSVYHGIRPYSIAAVLTTRVLLDSYDGTRGHDGWAPGVHTSPQLETAAWYATPQRFVNGNWPHGAGPYHRVVLELRVMETMRSRSKVSGGIQWVFPGSACHIVAVWIEVNTALTADDKRIDDWDPALEAIPALDTCLSNGQYARDIIPALAAGFRLPSETGAGPAAQAAHAKPPPPARAWPANQPLATCCATGVTKAPPPHTREAPVAPGTDLLEPDAKGEWWQKPASTASQPPGSAAAPPCTTPEPYLWQSLLGDDRQLNDPAGRDRPATAIAAQAKPPLDLLGQPSAVPAEPTACDGLVRAPADHVLTLRGHSGAELFFSKNPEMQDNGPLVTWFSRRPDLGLVDAAPVNDDGWHPFIMTAAAAKLNPCSILNHLVYSAYCQREAATAEDHPASCYATALGQLASEVGRFAGAERPVWPTSEEARNAYLGMNATERQRCKVKGVPCIVFHDCLDMLRVPCCAAPAAAVPLPPLHDVQPTKPPRCTIPPEEIDAAHPGSLYWGNVSLPTWRARFVDPESSDAAWHTLKNELQKAIDSRQKFRDVDHFEIADCRRDELKARGVFVHDKSLTWQGKHEMHGKVNKQ